jgi:hypothetical protein
LELTSVGYNVQYSFKVIVLSEFFAIANIAFLVCMALMAARYIDLFGACVLMNATP